MRGPPAGGSLKAVEVKGAARMRPDHGKKEVRKKTPEEMGKVLYWIAAERAAEARKQYDESRFPGTAVTVYSILYNLTFMRLALLRKYSASVVNEVHCLAVDELDRQYGTRIRGFTPESALELARRVTFSAASCLDDIAQGDQSALYQLAKEYLRDISSEPSGAGPDREGSVPGIFGADILLLTCALLAGWINAYYLNEIYEIVSEGPAEGPLPAAPAPPGPGPGPVPASAAPAAAVPVQPPAAEAPAAPSGKAFGWKPLARSAACLLVLALVFCGGYAMGKRSTPEKDPDWYEWKSYGVSSSQTWVYISRTGTKYHRTSSCSNMDVPIYTTLDEAVSLGYARCSKCW